MGIGLTFTPGLMATGAFRLADITAAKVQQENTVLYYLETSVASREYLIGSPTRSGMPRTVEQFNS
jgi:hypothetical protein